MPGEGPSGRVSPQPGLIVYQWTLSRVTTVQSAGFGRRWTQATNQDRRLLAPRLAALSFLLYPQIGFCTLLLHGHSVRWAQIEIES